MVARHPPEFDDTESGLAAYAYTRDLGRARSLVERLDYGMVGITPA